ncbi:MAG: hypothetical protein HEQ24_14830 [Dolichospermum sp. BR01]|nr:hypothetical protein [Dolichospermum sp. BR01]
MNSLERADETVSLDNTDAYQIRWNRKEDGCKFEKLERGNCVFEEGLLY